jgi:hypothetical protein
MVIFSLVEGTLCLFVDCYQCLLGSGEVTFLHKMMEDQTVMLLVSFHMHNWGTIDNYCPFLSLKYSAIDYYLRLHASTSIYAYAYASMQMQMQIFLKKQYHCTTFLTYTCSGHGVQQMALKWHQSMFGCVRPKLFT